MKKLYFTLIVFNICTIIIAQNVGIGISTPNTDALLDIYSTKQGFLPTRIELVQTDLSDPLLNHVAGMITYNTTESEQYNLTSVHDGFYYNDGSQWNLAGPNVLMLGDLKHSLATNDYSGWYLLNGRAISTLPTVAQNNAISIGQTTNLINASDRFLKAKSNSESSGNCSGSKTFIINQSNLPNVNFTGTTSSNGSHTHQVDSYLGFQNIGLLSTSSLTLFSIEQVAKDETLSTNKTTELKFLCLCGNELLQ